MRGVETIKFNDFMSGAHKQKEEKKKAQKRAILKATATTGLYVTALKISIPVAAITLPLFLTSRALAATTAPVEAIPVIGIPDAVKEKIIHAFDPLVDLMISLSAPIAGVMITGGSLMVMIGMKEKGYGLIMSAALGYILVQMSPLLINLLIGIGGAV